VVIPFSICFVLGLCCSWRRWIKGYPQAPS
jgi:hypothetical protein